MSVLKILVIAGSVRTGSVNARLAAAVMRELALANIDVTRISLADYPLPLYDGDTEMKTGVPRNALGLKRLIGLQHGVLIVSPEYNASVPPLLKNAIDWVSRVHDRSEERGAVFRSRVFAIASASDGQLGGARGLMALRQVLTQGCGAHVIPAQLSVRSASEAFDEMDALKDSRDADGLRAMVKQLIDVSQRMM